MKCWHVVFFFLIFTLTPKPPCSLWYILSMKEKRWQNPRPKTRKPNPNPREENGKKRGKREKREGRVSLNKYLIIVRQVMRFRLTCLASADPIVSDCRSHLGRYNWVLPRFWRCRLRQNRPSLPVMVCKCRGSEPTCSSGEHRGYCSVLGP